MTGSLKPLTVILLAVSIMPSIGHSQEAQQTPQVETENKSNRSLESEQKPSAETAPTPPASASAPHVVSLAGDNERQRDARHREEEGNEFWPPFFGYRVKVTDSLLAIFTFLLFVAPVLLWLATRRLVRGAEDTSIRQLRAYVLVSGAQVMDVTKPERRIVQLSIRNFGKTPAHDVLFWMGTNVTWFPLRDNVLSREPPEGFRTGNDILPPEGPGVMAVEVGTTNEPQEAILQTGDAAIYAYGRVTYIDAFNKPRITEFRYMCRGEGLVTGRMSPCEEGNKYT
jgi:hypothetical protein